MDKIN